MSIGKDITNKKPKLRPERFADAFEKQEEKQAQREEERLESASAEPKMPKQLKTEAPEGNIEAPANHFGVLVDAEKSKVIVAGGKKKKRNLDE